jgi:uncharacterized protein
MSELLRGFAFPVRIDDRTGGLRLQAGDDKLRDNIVQILLTTVGERLMERDYGTGIRQLLHDPNDDALHSIAKYQIAKAVGRLEPRVLVQDITIETEAEQLLITVAYIVRRTRRAHTARVPIAFV